jgi:hypothetical protein
MPLILKAEGIVVGDVKNQYIFMQSPSSQLAKTENRNPLQDLDRAFESICGIGSVASMDSPV